MNKYLFSGLLVLLMNGCQPQPDDTPPSRPALATDRAPSKADASQVRDRTAPDAVNPSAQAQRDTPPASNAPAPGDPDVGKAAHPPPQQVDAALAACERLPAEQQTVCKERIRSATDRADGQRSEDPPHQ